MARASAASSALTGLLMLLGRIAFCCMFILSGIKHFADLEHTTQGVGGAMPFIPEGLQGAFAIGAGVLLLGGGVLILLGLWTRLGGAMIVLFLIPTLLFFHNYWAKPPDEVQMQTIQFMKNLAMLGGALFIVGAGGGPYSLDALLRRKR